VSGVRRSLGRPYCSAVLDLLNGFIKYFVYDLDNRKVFFERDSKRLEVALGKTRLVYIVLFSD